MSSAALKAAATGQVKAPPKTILDFLNDPRVQRGLGAVAGKFLGPDRMLRLCINAVKKTPLLMQCDPQSVLGAMMASTALGLEPNTVQQQAFLMPYKRRAKIGNDWVDVYDCQFQVGARGFVTLAYRSPDIKLLTAEAIHDGDHFKNRIGSGAFLEYEKNLRDRGALIGAFSYVQLQSGSELACVLPLDEILKIRSRSETFRALSGKVETAENDKERAKAEQKLADTPWVMWEDDMAAKSAIKKHAKQLPIASSDSIVTAAELDNRSDASTLDLRAMADPDVTRAVATDGVDVPALESNATEGFEGGGEAFGATARQAETVSAASSASGKADKPASKAKAKPEAGAAPVATKKTYAQLTDEVLKSPDAEAAGLVLDEARAHLNEDLQAELGLVYRNKFGG